MQVGESKGSICLLGLTRVPFKGVYKGYYKGSIRVLLLIGSKLNFWGSYRVVDSESFNFYSLGLWASESEISDCWTAG